MVYTQCTRYVLLKYQILLKSTKMALPKVNQVLCVCGLRFRRNRKMILLTASKLRPQKRNKHIMCVKQKRR